MTITEFLLARIEEDEEAALWAGGPAWTSSDDPDAEDILADADNWLADSQPVSALASRDTRAHIARHDPARVRRECEAKRRIVGGALGFRSAAASMHGGDLRESIRKDVAEMMATTAEDALKPLAAVYSDHPDYDPEWAV